MLAVNNVTMRFGPRVLFENVTCTFMAGGRYAITGPNGAGKSTFMKILTGELDSTSGSVTRPKKMGVLRQDQFAFDEYRVIDTVIMGNAALWKALEERDALYAKPHEQLTDADGMRLGELEGIVGEEGGYTAEADSAVLVDGLGVEGELHERKMGELQGGQKVRVLLAQALFGNPTALLLDEPTNNLDLDSVHWLQRYLCEYEGVLIVISHDRHFLNSVCTYTADIDYETIIMYVGGYDDMVVAKTQIRGRIEADNANREKKIAQLQEFIARFSAGTRSAQATSRKKEVERLQTTELARSNIQRPYIKFDMKRNSGKHPLEIRSVEKSYDDLKVITRFSASVFSGEDALKPTRALSGGESARLIFCRLMLQKPNFLVLDEPTNHLDLESINALNIALQRYDGTVLLVTHDHDVIDEVATRIWHFHGGKTEDFKGTYEEFVAYEEAKAAQAPAAPARAGGARRAPVPS